MIRLQNLLFVKNKEIQNEIKNWSTTLVLNHEDAVEMRESLKLSVAMLEQAEAKVTGH